MSHGKIPTGQARLARVGAFHTISTFTGDGATTSFGGAASLGRIQSYGLKGVLFRIRRTGGTSITATVTGANPRGEVVVGGSLQTAVATLGIQTLAVVTAISLDVGVFVTAMGALGDLDASDSFIGAEALSIQFTLSAAPAVGATFILEAAPIF